MVTVLDIVDRWPFELRRFQALERLVAAKLSLDGAKDAEPQPRRHRS
jgi:hypothetical protein